MPVLPWLSSLALALELDPGGRWVEAADVSVGDATVHLDAGLLFPVTEAGSAVGFVFVGDASLAATVASSSDALSVRAALPELPLRAGQRWTERGEVVLAVGLREEILAGAGLGHPLIGDRHTVGWLDEAGREHVLVTGLDPARARERAAAALRERSGQLAAARLDPEALLAREAWRTGERRAVVELRPERDLGALIGAVDDTADIGRTWLTWVIDPTGLVDERRGQVLLVHGPGEVDHPVRVLTGVPLAGAPAWTAARAELNLVVDPPIGVAATAHDQLRLELVAGERGRWVDLWLPRSLSALAHGQVVVGGDPELTRVTLADGTPIAVEQHPFGRAPLGDAWVELGLLLPTEIEAGASTALRLDWHEAWDVGGVLDAKEWVSHELKELNPMLVQPEVPDGVPATMTLGRVMAGVPALPFLPTDPGGYPAEIRAGTTMTGFQASMGGGPSMTPWEDGRLWVGKTDGPTTVTIGDLSEVRDGAVGPYPAIRLLSHGPEDPHMPARIRAILHFYGTALPPYPHPEVVVIEGQRHPELVLLKSLDRSPARPDPTKFRSPGSGHPLAAPDVWPAGQGQIVVEGVVAIPAVSEIQIPGAMLGRTYPHAAERGLAEALAAGWFEDLPWPEQDRWLARAIPKVLRDRFVAEAWPAQIASTWDAIDEERLSREMPSEGLVSLVGTDDWWADEVGARFLGRAIGARIGERALLEGIARTRASGAPSLDRLVADLEATSRTPLRDSFDAFVVAGLRPDLSGTWQPDEGGIRVHLTADVPLGTYEVPVVATVGRSQTTAWVRLVDGVGEGLLAVRSPDSVVIDPDHAFPVRGRHLHPVDAVAPELVGAPGSARPGEPTTAPRVGG